jgi:hypothetical protein
LKTQAKFKEPGRTSNLGAACLLGRAIMAKACFDKQYLLFPRNGFKKVLRKRYESVKMYTQKFHLLPRTFEQ